MVGSAPLMKILMNTQSSKMAHSSSVVCHPSRWKLPSASFKLTSCRTRSETKKHVDVNAAIHPITVSHPTTIRPELMCFDALRTGDVAAKFLVGSRAQERDPMVLASGSGHSARKLADADEDGEIPKPDEDEAVD
jgi:hypothetical protein